MLKFTSLKIAKDTVGGMNLHCRLRAKRREGGEGREEAVEERGVRGLNVVPRNVRRLNVK